MTNDTDPFQAPSDCLTPTLIIVVCVGLAAVAFASALVIL